MADAEAGWEGSADDTDQGHEDGQRCRATLRHCRNRVPQGCSRGLREFRHCCGIPFILLYETLRPAATHSAIPPPTSVKGPAAGEEGVQDVDHERPKTKTGGT